ncbi:hypothetical protein [Zhongshania borealis]|uniref:Uncharacterized protein n=1 Tax=Zhongshania borealis TaxID=889488 RepID=A0ABP7WPL7_9GAMM
MQHSDSCFIAVLINKILFVVVTLTIVVGLVQKNIFQIIKNLIFLVAVEISKLFKNVGDIDVGNIKLSSYFYSENNHKNVDGAAVCGHEDIDLAEKITGSSGSAFNAKN